MRRAKSPPFVIGKTTGSLVSALNSVGEQPAQAGVPITGDLEGVERHHVDVSNNIWINMGR